MENKIIRAPASLKADTLDLMNKQIKHKQRSFYPALLLAGIMLVGTAFTAVGSSLLSLPGFSIEDNTPASNIEFIAENLIIRQPLDNIKVIFHYNDYKENGLYLHPEIDLFAELGESIYPFAAGVVAKAEYDENYGHYIIIDHGDGILSRYNHCDELRAAQGDEVNLTDTIATVGKSGAVTGVHLAFSVTVDGIPLNPTSFFEIK